MKNNANNIDISISGLATIFKLFFFLLPSFILYKFIETRHTVGIQDLPGAFVELLFFYFSLFVIVGIRYHNGKLYIRQFIYWKELNLKEIDKIQTKKAVNIYVTNLRYLNIFKIFIVPCVFDTSSVDTLITILNSIVDDNWQLARPSSQPSLMHKTSVQTTKQETLSKNIKIIKGPMMFKMACISTWIILLYPVINNIDLAQHHLLPWMIGLLLYVIFIYCVLVTIVAIKYENNKLFILQFFGWKKIDIKSIKELDPAGESFCLNTIKYCNIFKRFGIPYPGSSGELLARTLKENHGIGRLGSEPNIRHNAD